MTEEPRKLARFFREVWRRHVLQVALPYCVGGWLLIEVAEVVLDAFEAPNFVLQAVLVVFALGLPVVVVLAWVFDITPAGLVRTAASPDESAAEPEPAPAMALSMGDSERRQISMLSCVFDFQTGDGPEQDPEFLRDAISGLESIFNEITGRFHAYRLPGAAEQLSLVFGYPTARDDDARRAVAAGLALAASVNRIDSDRDGCPDVSVRIGIHTGLVVVEEPKQRDGEITVIGQAPRFVAWLRSIAPAGAVALSAQTRALVERFHACESLGRFQPPQTAAQVEVFRATAELPSDAVWSAGAQVGREQELAVLKSRWDNAMDGDGQFVLVKGEPGIGKTSLMQAFQKHVAGGGDAWILSAYCSPYEQSTAMHPMAQALRGPVLGFEADDGNAQRMQKLQSFVDRHAKGNCDALFLLANLLALPLHGAAQDTGGASAQLLRTRTLELLVQIIRDAALKRPVLLSIEDLLWADPSTLEWIRMWVEEGPTPGVFLLLTARPAFEADWTRRSYVMTMDLLPLPSRGARALVQQTAGEVVLPEALIDHIVRETGGNPLYVHELTRAVVESGEAQAAAAGGNDDLGWLKIPATLQDSLAARIDHLGPAKALLLLCSVLGREFDYEQLRAVSGTQNETAFRKDLDQIVRAELLFQRGRSKNPRYSFKHMLIQEAAYNSLLKSTRKELHARTAQIIEHEYPEIERAQPAVLAWHHGEAGNADRSIALWTQAARQSLAAFANLEAIAQAERGLDTLASVPDPGQRLACEVPLQSLLGMALLATRGYAAPEVRQVFTRSRALCEQLGDSPQLFRVVVGLWMFYFISGDFEEALELSRTLLRIAETGKDPAHLLQSRYCLGNTLFYRAEYQAARAHLEAAMAGEVDGYDYAAQSASGDDTRAHVRITLAHLNWHLGRPLQASRYMDEAIRIARAGNHPYGIAFAMFSAAWFNVLRRDTAGALACARQAVELAEEKGYRFFQPPARFMLTWAEGRAAGSDLEPRDAEVVEQLNQCVAMARANGSRVAHTFLYFVVTEDMLFLNRCDEAAALLEQTWARMEKSSESFLAPEYFRLTGKLSQLRGEPMEQAIAHFRKALERARRSETRGLELRAANDLAGALAGQGEAEEPLNLLDGVLKCFAETDDSSDFRQAKLLLKDLRKQLKRR